MMSDIKDLGIKVELLVDYSVVCETLERVGIVNKQEKKIFPSCYCYKIDNADGTSDYRICHFKELFTLQDKPTTFSKLDSLRLKTIVYFLKKWNLIKVPLVDGKDPLDAILKDKIDVVKFSDKKDYQIVHKFRGNKL
jgi:hypothetical protein